MDAKESLVICLLEMAEAETNPVLQIIDPDSALEENKKYPVDLLQFNHSGWRAYYHCHPATRAGNHRFQGEHGHFHIFVRTQNESEKWSHLVALAMDNMGQPLGWFTVNHWVTGEAWESSEALSKSLKSISLKGQYSLVEKWLLSLLVLSCNEVSAILSERDKMLNQKKNLAKGKDIKQSKELYLLSEVPIDLKALLDINQHDL